MISIINPTKIIRLINDDEVSIVNIPQVNIIDGQKSIKDYLDKKCIQPNEVKDQIIDPKTFITYTTTWKNYLDDCLLVQQSLRVGSNFTDGKVEYGEPYFKSLESYLAKVGNEHSSYHQQVLEFRGKLLPDIDNISEEQASKLIEDILKKKSIDSTLDLFNWNMLRSFITFMGNHLQELHLKSLQNTSYSNIQK